MPQIVVGQMYLRLSTYIVRRVGRACSESRIVLPLWLSYLLSAHISHLTVLPVACRRAYIQCTSLSINNVLSIGSRGARDMMETDNTQSIDRKIA